MKKLWLALAITLGALSAPSYCDLQDARPAAVAAEKRVTFEHRAFSALLERHVHGELVNYTGLMRDRGMLDMYAKSVATVTPADMDKWDREERMAFWINVYNAYTLQLILDHYDAGKGKYLDSIMAISNGNKNAWNLAIIPMPAFHPDGKEENLTLDQIENKILRPQFGEPRIHVAVNCASVGCPPLRGEAFSGANLEKQLAEQMKEFMAQPSRNAFEKNANKVELSNIFDWYGDDFKTEATDAEPATDLRDYLIANGPTLAGVSAKDRAWIRDAHLSFGEYDWNLNDYRP
jgi:hypothetical protein